MSYVLVVPPPKLISDSAQVEISNKVKYILHYLYIEDWQSEAYHQHQNPTEWCYQDIKHISNRLLDRTGSPHSLWLLALKYTAFLLNHTSCPSLNNAIPLSYLTGTTPDISSLLQFHWYEKIYFHEEEPSFPSESPECSSHFVGFAKNIGHTLTYAILTTDTNKIIYHSEVRSAEDPSSVNLRTHNWGDESVKTEEIIHSRVNNDDLKPPMAIIDVEDLVGRTFKIPTSDGKTSQATVIEAIRDHGTNTTRHSTHTKFHVSHGKDKYEEILTYNDIMDHLDRQEEGSLLWELRHIVSHQGPLSKEHPSYNGSPYNVKVEWENGEFSEEPLSTIAVDAPVACAIYAKKKSLLDKPG